MRPNKQQQTNAAQSDLIISSVCIVIFSCHLAAVLQEGRKYANIHARSGVIWGIPDKAFAPARISRQRSGECGRRGRKTPESSRAVTRPGRPRWARSDISHCGKRRASSPSPTNHLLALRAGSEQRRRQSPAWSGNITSDKSKTLVFVTRA